MDNRFKQEITRLFYKQAPFVSISLFFVLGISYTFFNGILPDTILVTWIAFNLLFSIALLLCYFAYRHYDPTLNSDFWLKFYILLEVLQDISLGTLGPMSAFVADETTRLFILFLLAGAAAGAIATRGILFKVYLTSISALLIPAAITHAVMDHTLSNVMLLLTLVFYIFMLFVGKNYSDNIRNNIFLWLNLEQEVETRKHTEKELLQAKLSAEIANETKNHFLASVSHELRTPLTGIIGFSSALNNSSLIEPQKSYAEHIGLCSNTLLNMVNDVLDITTIEAGGLELRHAPFNLLHEMNEVIALAQRLSADKGLSFEHHVSANLPKNFIGDSHRIKQIINNLISNAIKYTDKGFIKLDITLSSVTEHVAHIQFNISDSGIGIPQNAHATLFETFTQAKRLDNKRYDGVGLGLSIVSSLLQKMNGQIEFDTEENKGSCFKVRLPLELNTSSLAPSVGTCNESLHSIGSAPSPDEKLTRLRVLIVDDNKINRLVLKTFLDHHHIPYNEAASGSEALQQLQNHDFDLVLLDINMPEMSGIEVRESYFRGNTVHPHFVAITAHALKEEVDNILNSGFEVCLIKPVLESDLLSLLKRFAT